MALQEHPPFAERYRAKSRQRLDTLLKAWQQACHDSENGWMEISVSAGIAVHPQEATDLQALYWSANESLSEIEAADRTLVLS